MAETIIDYLRDFGIEARSIEKEFAEEIAAQPHLEDQIVAEAFDALLEGLKEDLARVFLEVEV